MSGGNKRRRKKCRWNICHLGINVVQSSKWILLRHIILNFVEFSGKLVLSIYRTYDTSEEIAIWKKSTTDEEEIRMKKVQNEI